MFSEITGIDELSQSNLPYSREYMHFITLPEKILFFVYFNLKVRTCSPLYLQHQNRAWHIVCPQQMFVKWMNLNVTFKHLQLKFPVTCSSLRVLGLNSLLYIYVSFYKMVLSTLFNLCEISRQKTFSKPRGFYN